MMVTINCGANENEDPVRNFIKTVESNIQEQGVP